MEDLKVNNTEQMNVVRHSLVVPPEAEDANGHVNNVVYVQWMQDVAIMHSNFVGGDVAMREAGCTWVVRSHQIEYLCPAHAGDMIEVSTWVVNVQRARSLRRYRFVRLSDNKVLAQGETQWVFVHAQSGRPAAIPESVRRCYQTVGDEVGG